MFLIQIELFLTFCCLAVAVGRAEAAGVGQGVLPSADKHMTGTLGIRDHPEWCFCAPQLHFLPIIALSQGFVG